jgi:hypothetical protein
LTPYELGKATGNLPTTLVFLSEIDATSLKDSGDSGLDSLFGGC